MSAACSTTAEPSSTADRLDPADQRAAGGGAVDERCREDRPQHRAGRQVRAELLEQQRPLDHAEPAAARVLGQQQAEHAERRHLVPGGPVGGRPLPLDDGVEGEAVGAEPGHGLLQLDLSGVQAELHHPSSGITPPLEISRG